MTHEAPTGPAAPPARTAPGETLIRISGLCKRFGDNTVLDQMAAQVERGTNFVIMGLSGAGKSVTLKILCGLLQPDSGEVSVGGVRLDGASQDDVRAVRARMGFVFQGAALLNWLSAFENVALPLREAGVRGAEVTDRVNAKLEAVGLAEAGHKYPAELSGGMRKRVGFARAVVMDPDLVLYDEPTTGLDPLTALKIDRMIIKGRDELGTTGVVVSHDPVSALRVADRIGLMHEGRLVVVGTPAEFVKSDHPVVRTFLDTSLEFERR